MDAEAESFGERSGRCRGCGNWVVRDKNGKGHPYQSPIDGSLEECGPVDCPADVPLLEAKLEQAQRENTEARRILSGLLADIKQAGNGFQDEEDFVVWQRSVNAWEHSGHALLEDELVP